MGSSRELRAAEAEAIAERRRADEAEEQLAQQSSHITELEAQVCSGRAGLAKISGVCDHCKSQKAGVWPVK